MLLLVGSVALAAEPPGPEMLSPEQLQQALLRMKFDVEIGSRVSPDLLKRFGERLKPEEMPKLLEQMKDNPLFKQLMKDRGIESLPNLPQDPKAMQKIQETLKSISPPKTLPKGTQGEFPPFDPSKLVPKDITVPEYPEGLPIQPTPKQTRPRGDRDRRYDTKRPLTPEEQRRERTAKSLAKTWERFVGPIEDNPSLRNALMDMVLAGEDFKTADGSDFWKFLEQNAGPGSGEDLGDFLNNLDSLGGDWKLPKLDFSGLDFSGWSWNSSSNAAPDLSGNLPSASVGSLDGGWFSGDSWTPVILFVLVAIAALLAWRFWPSASQANLTFTHHASLGPWPVDPRRLSTRAEVVQAFEYLSLLRCGLDSRSWNHLTIALALARLTSDGEAARDVARLYAQARYAPAADEFSANDLDRARQHICRLAGLT